MSLPLAFGTTLETVPASAPYLFAEADKQKRWNALLGHKSKVRVGLAWSGSAAHKNDRNRSIPLKLLTPLLSEAVEFHALQKEIRPDDAEFLEHVGRVRLHREELDDFSDTAALIAAMDLIISVDTSVAHLAGAMAKPVWILLPFRPDYRWMLDRTDSPWYPTATLFRQTAIGDWDGVVAEVVQKLENLEIQGDSPAAYALEKP